MSDLALSPASERLLSACRHLQAASEDLAEASPSRPAVDSALEEVKTELAAALADDLVA